MIMVKLVKHGEKGLGFLVRQRPETPHVVVAELIPGGNAEQSQLINVGDTIMRVNEKNFSGIKYDKAIEILKAIPVGSSVHLLLQCAEGYQAYLETTWDENGCQRTSRVTRCLQNHSVLSRIRQAFSPSPVRNRRKKCIKGSDVATATEEQIAEIADIYVKDVFESEDLDDCAYYERPASHNLEVKANCGSKLSSLVLKNNNLDNINDTHKENFESTDEGVNDGRLGSNRTDSQVDVHVPPKMALESDSQEGPCQACIPPGNQGVSLTSTAPQNGVVLRKPIEIIQLSRDDIAVSRDDIAVSRDDIVVNRDDIAVTVKGDMDIKSDFSNPFGKNTSSYFVISNEHPSLLHSDPSDDNLCPISDAEACLEKSKEKASGVSEMISVKKDSNYKRLFSPSNHPSSIAVKDVRSEVNCLTMSPSHVMQESQSSSERCSSMSSKKFAKLRNLLDDKYSVDVLHQKSTFTVGCNETRCMGSLLQTHRNAGPLRTRTELIEQAKEFIEQYYESIKRLNTTAYQNRLLEVQNSIEEVGNYELNTAELIYGAKSAWRNASRCVGRIQWNKLQVFDARHIHTARGMFEALCNHIKYGTNKGKLRSAITIFPHRTNDGGEFRVWNPQLIMYAGYRQADGTIIGDPKSAEFTEVVIKMGWRPICSNFDVLPLVLSAGNQDPEMFIIPSKLVLEVNITHPKYEWFKDLGLKWYALPAVSSMLFDCGGLEFTACPFSGWYMGTEIGSRNLCDANRYNVLEKVASKMGLDVKKTSSLWKDTALVDVNIAVLHSFQSAGVTITDHHTASDAFMKHMENENRLRGGCPADWVWIVPPISASVLPTFHQEMLLYKLTPSYEYQENPWKTHVWIKDGDKRTTHERMKRKFGFRELARAVKFSAKLMGRALARRVKCTILYATETGKSERFSNILCRIFKHAFDAKEICMDLYDVTSLEHESLVLVITSTFGNGDPPENGEALAKSLYEMKYPEKTGLANFSSSSYIRMNTRRHHSDKVANVDQQDGDQDNNLTTETGPLSNVRYSIFALGSRAYPHFGAFGHYMNRMLTELGADSIYPLVEGDELCGQEESFRNWAKSVFNAACETFCLGDDVNIGQATCALSNSDLSWSPALVRLTTVAGYDDTFDVCEALSKQHGKRVLSCRLTDRKQLQSPQSQRQTILIKLNTQDTSELQYLPGDHIGIFPKNSSNLVEGILTRLPGFSTPDAIVRTEYLQENSNSFGSPKTWVPRDRLQACSLRTALTYILDITTPPSQALLQLLATVATSETDTARLELLAKDSKQYEDWRYYDFPNLLEVLNQFPSIKMSPSLLTTQLPMIQNRFYSISSSPMDAAGEIHATITIVNYRTRNGKGAVHEGVCSGWLNRCEIGEVIPCIIRMAPTFHMPEDKSLPLIMVGPGTGIAPYRSFWLQREIDMEMSVVTPDDGCPSNWGKMILYFGCRQNSLDNIYADDLENMKKDKILNEYYVALSREPGQKKIYVQDLLRKNGLAVFKMVVEQSGHFYICGDVTMASDVTTTLENIIRIHGNIKPNKAKDFILKLKDSNRLHEDIFGVSNYKRSAECEKYT